MTIDVKIVNFMMNSKLKFYKTYFPCLLFDSISLKETHEFLIFWPKWLYFALISLPIMIVCQAEFFNKLDMGHFGLQDAVTYGLHKNFKLSFL